MHFSAYEQKYLSVAPYLYQKGRFLKKGVFPTISRDFTPGSLFLPCRDKELQLDSVVFKATESVKYPTLFAPLTNLKDNSYKTYLLLKSFNVPFFVDWTPALEDSFSYMPNCWGGGGVGISRSQKH